LEKMLIPFLALGGAVVALFIALSKEEKETLVDFSPQIPDDKRRQKPLATFTRKDVFWKTVSDKKTKLPVDLYRVSIEETPADLCKTAIRTWKRLTGEDKKISPNAFVLGTMVASEVGELHPLAKVGVAHAAVNMARLKKMRLTKLLTPDGRFGSQQGRYATTARPPTIESIEIAQHVLDGKIADPTYGAMQFDSTGAQREGVAAGWAGYNSLPEDIAKTRSKEGKVAVYLPGVDPEKIRFWRPVSPPTLVALADLPNRW
jgi:hypothetical protein